MNIIIFTPATLQATYGTQFNVPLINLYSNSSSEHYYLPAFPSNQPAKQSHLASFSYSDMIKIGASFPRSVKNQHVGKTPQSCRNRSILS